ncbi:hypothetical protein FACS189492_0890 [Clostridia bacterium]|nr:hypothetical protein FACS189492_0890 [Clostridia bacterium]
MKRILALFLALCALSTSFPISTAANRAEVYATLTRQGKSSNLTVIDETGKSPEYVVKSGREGRRLSETSTDKRLTFDVSNAAMYSLPRGSAVEVSVDYFDEFAGHFAISYDSATGQKDTDIVIVDNSGKWKTHIFYLYDVSFSNKLYGGDFCLNLNPPNRATSPRGVVFGEVRVRRMGQGYLNMKVASRRSGNIFLSGEEVALDVSFSNNGLFRAKYDISYKLTAEDESEILWQGKDVLDIGVRSPITKTVRPHLEKYGLYLLEINCLGQNGALETRLTTQLSYVMHDPNVPPNEKLGTCVHLGTGAGVSAFVTPERDSAAVLPLVAGSGIGFIRDDMRWKDYERQKGVFTFAPNWEKYVSDAERNGLKPLIILGYENPLYYPETHKPPQTPEELAAFERYVYNLVSRLGDRVQRYEVWNEPNLMGSDARYKTPEAYLPALKVAYETVKRANPNAIVMGGVTSNIPGNNEGIVLSWLERLLEIGGGDYMDVLSFHYYFWTHRTLDVNLDGQLKQLDEAIQKYKPSLKMAVTEFGWSVHHAQITQNVQADNFLKNMAIVNEFERMSQVYWYEFQDSGLDAVNMERNLGFVRFWNTINTPYAAKPIYLAASAYNTLVGDTRFLEKYESNDAYVYRYAKNQRGKDVLMMWSERKTDIVSLDLGCETVTVYDRDGNGTKLYGIDGVFTFGLGDTPSYVEGDFVRYGVCPPKITLSKTTVETVSGDVAELEISVPNGASIDVKYDDGIEPRSLEHGVFRFVVDGELGESLAIHVSAKADDKLYLSCQISVRLIAPATIQVSMEPYYDAPGKWLAHFRVKNNRNSGLLNGTARIEQPGIFADKVSAVKFNGLQPGAVGKYTLFLPELYGCKYFNMVSVVDIEGYDPIRFTNLLDDSCTKYASVPPKIDGSIALDEYDRLYALNTVKENVIESFGGAYLGEKDISATFYAAWDNDNLYLAAEVTDDVHYQVEEPGNMWRGDSMQVSLYVKDILPVNVTELGVSLRGNAVQKVVFSKNEYMTIDPASMNCAIKRYEGKTVYELSLPFARILPAGRTITEIDELGFSVLVNDNDGSDPRSPFSGRKGWVEYGSGVGGTKSPALHANLRLLK